MGRTRGELEARLSTALVQFVREHLGRGPEEARTRVFEDVVFVRLTGVLTRAEKQLVNSEDGSRLIREMRQHLMASARAGLEGLVAQHAGCQVVSLYSDLSIHRGEQIIVFIVDRDLERDCT